MAEAHPAGSVVSTRYSTNQRNHPIYLSMQKPPKLHPTKLSIIDHAPVFSGTIVVPSTMLNNYLVTSSVTGS